MYYLGLSLLLCILFLACSEDFSPRHPTYSFEVDTLELSLEITLDQSLLAAYHDVNRSITVLKEQNEEDLSREFYELFLSEKDSDLHLKRLLSSLCNVAYEHHIDTLEVVIAFVQMAIEYDHSKASQKKFMQNYALETLYFRKGVCSDKAILLGKLLTFLDYEYVFFTFPQMQHMGVGLRVPSGYGSSGSDYCYVEVTSPHRMAIVWEGYQKKSWERRPP